MKRIARGDPGLSWAAMGGLASLDMRGGDALSETDASLDPAQRVRVFVVVGDEAVRRGLTDLLEYEGCEVVGGSDSALEAVSAIRHVRPEVVIVDGYSSSGTGLEASRMVCSADPSVRSLMLVSFNDENALCRVVLARASGYLLKEASNDRLVGEVRRLAAGQTLLSAGSTKRARERLTQVLSRPQPAWFTPLHERVALLIIEGLSNREVGARLGLPDTVVVPLVAPVLAALDL